MGKSRDMANLLNSSPANVDATTVDGLDSTQFVRADQADTINADLTVSGDLTVNGVLSGSVSYGDITDLPDPTVTIDGFASGSATMTDLGSITITTTRTNAPTFIFAGAVTGAKTVTDDNPTIVTSYDTTNFKNKVLEIDGQGSGVDADLLDAQEGTYYLDYTNFTNDSALMSTITSNDGSGSNIDADQLDGEEGTYYLDYNNFNNTPSSITDFGIVDGNDGQYLVTDGQGGFAFQSLVVEGSTDAGTLDGLDSTQFLRSDEDDTTTGTLTATAFSGPLTGNVTGNVTGDVTGDLTGDVTGNLTGDVTGNVTGNLTGDVTGNLTGNVDATTVEVGQTIEMTAQASHPTYQEGLIWYDNIHKTVNYYSDITDVVHEIGIEEHQRVYNNTASTLSRGKPVYFSGSHSNGSIKVPTVALADATSSSAYNAQGLLAGDIAANSYGYCIITGQLDGLDTSHLTAGSNVFVGVTPGALQAAAPTYPNFPICLGFVVNSDATDGVILLNRQFHAVESFRVETDAHVGGDLQVDGDLTVTGTTTTVSSADVTAGASMFRLNEGSAIGEAGTTFTGTGLDDAFFAGHFTGTTPTTYYVKIDGVGTGTGGVDTFAVSIDNFATTLSSANDITGNEQLIHSADNISVEFGSTTGHTLNDQWTGTASPINVDTGYWTNRNTGTSGVGYTHMGIWFDASDEKWKLVDEYDPTPDGTIDASHASYSTATLVANVEGDLTGDVTGNVTGDLTGDVTAGSISATGNITVGGTVDGRDIATDGTKLDTIATSATANPNALDNLVDDTSPQLGGDLDTNGNRIGFGTSQWTIEMGTGNRLDFNYNGTTVFSLSSDGAVISAADITAFGTP